LGYAAAWALLRLNTRVMAQSVRIKKRK